MNSLTCKTKIQHPHVQIVYKLYHKDWKDSELTKINISINFNVLPINNSIYDRVILMMMKRFTFKCCVNWKMSDVKNEMKLNDIFSVY